MSLRTRLPFLRWSVIRILLGKKRLAAEWNLGDGREEACARYVLANTRPGDIDAVIDAIDAFAYRNTFLMNVGDKKGVILDAAIERSGGRRVLELGAYVGYSALRIARKLPAGGKLISVEFNSTNAGVARRILTHAGVQDRVTIIVGYLADGGATIDRVKQEIGPGELDCVFVDHAKEAYLADLQRILDAGWLHPGAIVVADNVRFPGAPDYWDYMKAQEGKLWRTRTHETYAEYQTTFKDVVLESTLI